MATFIYKGYTVHRYEQKVPGGRSFMAHAVEGSGIRAATWEVAKAAIDRAARLSEDDDPA